MDLLLAVMPFADLDQPALGASMLSVEASAHGFTSRVHYFTFRLAELVGTDFYRSCHGNFGSTLLAGDWLFSEALFGASAPPADDFLLGALDYHRVMDDPLADLRRFHGMRFVEYLEEIVMPHLLPARAQCLKLADEAAGNILAASPRVAAFTVGSHQLCAALAVARRLKRAPNAPVIIFGGASCFGEMGSQILHSFPYVDYVCTGEGDRVLPDFLHRLLREGKSEPPAGLRAQGGAEKALPQPTAALDALPYPDFRDYFEQLRASPICPDVSARLSLPIETSRGCWWGQRKQCGFCGNHPQMQVFRSKSPERVVKEITHIVQTYQPPRLAFSDDILDHRYFQTLFPLLAAENPSTPFFCESKVNLTRSQLKQLHAAGCDMVQFGIESLSDRLLALLPKGCTAQHAIQSLRWSVELGMKSSWNFLYGIAGEVPEDYRAMAERLPLLFHLPPPLGCVRIAIKRFSPYFRNPQKYGLSQLKPSPGYSYTFPLPSAEIEGLAYYFDCEYESGDPLAYVTPVRHIVGDWVNKWSHPPEERPRLDLYRIGKSDYLVIDTRPCAAAPVHRLEGLAAEIYLHCDSTQSFHGLTRELAARAEADEVREALRSLINARLVWQDGDRYLSLAIFHNRRR